jgi:hypothetical protein
MHAAFHDPMILFTHSIQILTVSKETPLGEGALVLEGVERQGGRRMRVDGDHTGGAHM